jgi:hypothetical protein
MPLWVKIVYNFVMFVSSDYVFTTEYLWVTTAIYATMFLLLQRSVYLHNSSIPAYQYFYTINMVIKK